MVVCSSLQADLPNSAFNVSLPILLVITSPFSTSSSTLTWCIGTPRNLESDWRGDEKAQLSNETRPMAAIRRMRNRRLDVVLGVGIAVT